MSGTRLGASLLHGPAGARGDECEATVTDVLTRRAPGHEQLTGGVAPTRHLTVLFVVTAFLASALLSTWLVFAHPLESIPAKAGALLMITHFLTVPLLERAARLAGSDPARLGQRTLEEPT